MAKITIRIKMKKASDIGKFFGHRSLRFINKRGFLQRARPLSGVRKIA